MHPAAAHGRHGSRAHASTHVMPLLPHHHAPPPKHPDPHRLPRVADNLCASARRGRPLRQQPLWLPSWQQPCVSPGNPQHIRGRWSPCAPTRPSWGASPGLPHVHPTTGKTAGDGGRGAAIRSVEVGAASATRVPPRPHPPAHTISTTHSRSPSVGVHLRAATESPHPTSCRAAADLRRTHRPGPALPCLSSCHGRLTARCSS